MLTAAFARLCTASADWSFMDPPLFVLSRSESRRGSRTGARGLHLAVAWLGVGHQRPDQRTRRGGDLLDRVIEHDLVGLRGTGKAAQLADELQRRRAYLLVGGGRLEIEQGLDASAHGASGGTYPSICTRGTSTLSPRSAKNSKPGPTASQARSRTSRGRMRTTG